MKIVINTEIGWEFGLSREAQDKYKERTGRYFSDNGGHSGRGDEDLVAVVGELGEAAGGNIGVLAVVEIPDGVEWAIEEYEGREWVAERHRKWNERGEMTADNS